MPKRLARFDPADWDATALMKRSSFTGPDAETFYKRRLYYAAIAKWCVEQGLLNKFGMTDWNAFRRARDAAKAGR